MWKEKEKKKEDEETKLTEPGEEKKKVGQKLQLTLTVGPSM